MTGTVKLPTFISAVTMPGVMSGQGRGQRDRGDLRARYVAVRAQTEKLAAPLSSEDQAVQSMPDASPTKWHLAHTAWFFETFVLAPFLSGYSVFSPHYETLFNSYYNAVGSQFPRARRGVLSRPGRTDVLEYRHHVDRAMQRVLEDASDDALRLVELGLHHEQQHQELLLTDIKHALSLNPLRPFYLERASRGQDAAFLEGNDSKYSAQRVDTHSGGETQTAALDFVRYDGGIFFAGHQGEGFHFDNEGPAHRVLLADFELATRPINNQEVLSFIEAGGYQNPLLWLADGWAHIQSQQLTQPLYFEQSDDGWMQFTLHGFLPLSLAETACHLSYFEADAIARFLGTRLPTEFEWEHAAQLSARAAPEFNQHSLTPGRPDPHHAGLAQILGGVWEWTQSAYAPYPGYEPPQGAVGEYNGKFMHNQFVLRGSSCATPTDHARITYRNYFQSSAAWQFTGVRVAKGKNTP
jgi:ergothioneine biosynthesis protein EgtB